MFLTQNVECEVEGKNRKLFIPGFTIAMGVILTLPFTFGMSPIQGLATMMGVFVGGLSGGLMSGMLTGIPGTPSSVATTFDGFPMVSLSYVKPKLKFPTQKNQIEIHLRRQVPVEHGLAAPQKK